MMRMRQNGGREYAGCPICREMYFRGIRRRILKKASEQVIWRTTKKTTNFLFIWYKKSWRLTLTMPLKSESEAWFSNWAWRRSSIRRSADARRFVRPSVLLKTSIVKIPALFDDIMRSILSNCRGENWSIDRSIPFSYSALALYLKEPNWGAFPDFCKSRRWKYCLVNGRVSRVFLSGRSVTIGSTRTWMHTLYRVAWLPWLLRHSYDSCLFVLQNSFCGRLSASEHHAYWPFLVDAGGASYVYYGRRLQLHWEYPGNHRSVWCSRVSLIPGGRRWRGL